MFIDETYQRRIRINGAPDGLHGYKLTIHDIETGEQIMNVVGVAIYLSPGELNRADLTYYRGRNVEHGKVKVDNPEIAVSAYERQSEGQD